MNGLDPANVLKCWPRDESYLVGVSGGRDSVTLLHLLVKELAYPDLTVVHVDHQLRAESSEDALFVADLAKQLECPSVVRPIDVKTMASTWKCSIETAARRARHEVFAEIRAEKKAGGVFLGHHADDQVETILFRLFRGSGVSGLGGMREDTTIEIGGKALRLMRPLLRCWRSEIDQYVEANKIVFREDRSNAKPDHLRNRIRHQLIRKSIGRLQGMCVPRSSGPEKSGWRRTNIWPA
ncbi:MAG: tRNA lysidine(34) synthetase TilS [Verrucomicrobiota bacterium]